MLKAKDWGAIGVGITEEILESSLFFWRKLDCKIWIYLFLMRSGVGALGGGRFLYRYLLKRRENESRRDKQMTRVRQEILWDSPESIVSLHSRQCLSGLPVSMGKECSLLDRMASPVRR